MTLAAVLRLWDLGARALHHDESLHAEFAWYLYQGRGYVHDPLMHGPFQFHAVAAIYFLFGATDFTARLLPAMFGTILVGMPYLLRRQIGMKAVIIAAVLLCFSPSILYFSRFLRNDIYIAVFMFGIVICIWRYLDEVKLRWLYGLALLMALSFATKEVTFINVAILLLYLDIMLAVELGRRRDDEEGLSGSRVALRTLGFLPIAWAVAAFWPLLGKKPYGRDALPPVGDLLVLVGVLCLPQLSAAVQILPFVGDAGYNASSEHGLRLAMVVITLIASGYIGLLWRPKVFLICAALFYVPFVLLFTTFFTNMNGFFSGIWGSLDYWLAQQDVRRGNQPGYYYALMTPLYEFLPLLVTLAGSFWLIRKGDSFRRWLPFWFVFTFAGLSYAGEKMPWLEVHIALPLCIAAAVILAHLIDVLEFDNRRWIMAAGAAIATAAAVMLLVDGHSTPVLLAGAIIAGCLVGWAIGAAFGGFKMLARAVVTIVIAALFTLTVRASITASFAHGDTPVEMLVYTQTSPDITNLVHRIDALAKDSGLGYNLPIVVDGTDGYAWPWAWYLRNYHDVAYINDVASYDKKEGSVLLVNATNAGKVDATGYDQQAYKHRWWFDETYRGLTLSKVVDIATTPSRLQSLADFFLHRRPAQGNTGSVDGVAFFPQSLSAFDTGKVVTPPAKPSTLPDGRILFGRSGTGPGDLLQPAGIAVDPGGNIWVADARNNRLNRYDSSGNFVDSLATSGSAPGDVNQPWAVTVDSQGYVYVADTWNHRIEKFSPDLQFVAAWGTPSADANAPLDLFGPRDITIGPDGTLWFTDTGHKRIVNITTDGQPIAVYGGPGSDIGQFNEPVGITFGPDGRLYVADTWNGRIQSFATGAPQQIDTHRSR